MKTTFANFNFQTFFNGMMTTVNNIVSVCIHNQLLHKYRLPNYTLTIENMQFIDYKAFFYSIASAKQYNDLP